VGREQEVAELKRLLPKTRLLTLTGSGGTGKTRLSLQLAAEVLDDFKDGGWFVELAPLSDPMLVPAAVLRVVVARASDVSGVADTPYADMPGIAPIGVRIGHYLPVPQEAKGPAVDAAKGYRIEELGKGLYMITDNVYQSMFMVYETGVVVVDAPPSYATHIVEGVREMTDRPITHLIYSHSHTDHIGGTNALGKVPTIIAQEETKRLLARANDTNRPLPTTTFRDRYSLKAGSQD